MRRKWRCVCLSLVVFILIVSYKILEPELRGQKTDEIEDSDFADVIKRQEVDDANAVRQPELETNHEAHDQNRHMGEVLVPHIGWKKSDAQQSRDPDSQGVAKQKLIDKYLSMYDMDMSVQLPDNPWQLADSWVTTRHIHPDNATLLGGVIKRLATARILSADVGYKGTQLKLSFTLSGGRRASFKPKWYDRDHVISGRPFEGKDRHNGEIAAYHLQRILGYNRAPIAVGKTVDLQTDVLPVAEDMLKNTFFKTGNNTCFYGKCLYCKSEKDGVCAEGSKLEGALILWLPQAITFKKWRNPWQRVYDDPPTRKARWEVEDDYCDYIRQHPPYDQGPRLMDLMDAVVMDYLIGNADRHHYETFTKSDDDTLVMFDNAKSFGNPSEDEYSILAPLYQCCQIRSQTLDRLKDLQDGALSTVLRQILSRDPIAPVLHEPHYHAMDRRLITVLDEVNKCISKHGEHYVLVHDHYEGKPFS